MGAFYGSKIKNSEINPNTGKAWVLDDVRPYWKTKVIAWLEAENYSTE